jgi:hypothetical protein
MCTYWLTAQAFYSDDLENFLWCKYDIWTSRLQSLRGLNNFAFNVGKCSEVRAQELPKYDLSFIPKYSGS